MWHDMYEIAASQNTIVQYSDLGDVTTYIGNMTGFNQYDNPSTWAELKEANIDALIYSVDELNKELAEIS